LYSEMRKARDLSSALARREKFLSEASALLAGTLDFEQTMKAIVQIPIGSMADYCALDLLSDHGNSIEKVTSSTSFTIPREKLTRLESGDPVWNVIRSGKPQLSGPVPDYQLASVLIVPLRTQGHTIGALSLGSSSRAFDATDVEFGEKLALRVANALENSRLYRESTRAIRMREDLIAVVSHDLKNPLLSILMNAEMLLKTIEEPRDKKHLELIWTSAEQMKRLVLRILDLAKLEVGRTTLELRNLKIDEALQEAIGSIDAMVSERKPRIQLHLHDPAAEVRCDRERLVQILSNLLSNAVKFSPPGGTIRIRTRAEGDLILFSIQDQGPGIPPDQIPHIFDQYWQARGHRKLGTGLGLAIARGAVEAHGGHIWVESEPGKGATFHFTLKKAEASSAGGAAAAA
ncbi:MAG: GAF domain-containing sensor histidine kinase, partial [Bdellovibrionota bacterium]